MLLTESYLERNLATLGPANAELARLLRSTPPAEVLFEETLQEVLTGLHDGRLMASRHRPLDEAARLAEKVDVVRHAVVVGLGFGMGFHLRALAERMKGAGVLVIFEPDLGLLRAVLERVDHSDWLSKATIVWIHEADDTATLTRKLAGAESIVVQGLTFLEHPALRERLGERAAVFSSSMRSFVESCKLTLMTTLVRGVNTVRNLVRNIDHYALGDGMAPLKNRLAGRPAVVVSAGPSLKRNMHHLARPEVRDKCAIIAVQTTLKPLLAAGIRPHFVTALDYHEISRRFYDGLTPEDLAGVTLIAEPKAHPVILDVFPGRVRCCASDFLDQLLGPCRRDMGTLPAGSTVAHLAFYLARYLGCTSIAMIGQDLGFTDGLYYARGTAIDEVWAPELGPFNTIEMMEWQRIMRHRLLLSKTLDHEGKSIYTDAQMHTYLQQFERDFAEAVERGVRVVDATEGGVAKRHTERMSLAAFLDEALDAPLQPIPETQDETFDASREQAVRRRLRNVRREVRTLRDASAEAAELLRQMQQHQHDAARMESLFNRMESCRRKVAARQEVFDLLNHVNQLGVFKRQKHDRRLHLAETLSDLERQRAEMDRDLENVIWIADAAEEFLEMMSEADRIFDGERITAEKPATQVMDAVAQSLAMQPLTGAGRVAAIVPVDPEHNALGVPRSLAAPFGDRSVLQATLERLCQAGRLESIILLVPRRVDIEPLLNRERLRLPVTIDLVDDSPFGMERPAIAAARLWNDTSWRGGIGGMSGYDEALCPGPMASAMDRHGITAAIICAPEWPLVDPSEETGIDGLIARHFERPDMHHFVFTQAPVGLSCCLVDRTLMKELALRNRLSTAGGLLVYQPQAPQHDPIARDANVQVDHRVRRSLVRATFDAPRWRHLLESCAQGTDLTTLSMPELVEQLDTCVHGHVLPPQHVVVELTTARSSCGLLRRYLGIEGRPARPDMSLTQAETIFRALAGQDDLAVTFAGAGDPLEHPELAEMIRLARDCGVRGVHVRTELRAAPDRVAALIETHPDVISVDLHAHTANTYALMMGDARFESVLERIQQLQDGRRHLAGPQGVAAMALPWIVPRLLRCRETYEDLDGFFDHWQKIFGTALIEGVPPSEAWRADPQNTLASAEAPDHVMQRELGRRLVVLCDGRVPISEFDVAGNETVGNVTETPIDQLWKRVQERRRAMFPLRTEHARTAFP